jgi:hypothetical protein
MIKPRQNAKHPTNGIEQKPWEFTLMFTTPRRGKADS